MRWWQPVVALAAGGVFSLLAFRYFDSSRHPGRIVLCFLGFLIAMVWILMIVNEVVGVLQVRPACPPAPACAGQQHASPPRASL